VGCRFLKADFNDFSWLSYRLSRNMDLGDGQPTPVLQNTERSRRCVWRQSVSSRVVRKVELAGLTESESRNAPKAVKMNNLGGAAVATRMPSMADISGYVSEHHNSQRPDAMTLLIERELAALAHHQYITEL
jgi:hypothetical protein